MSKNLNETIGAVNYDGLIVDNTPAADVFSVTIRKEALAAATLKRGTVLALASGGSDPGKRVILGTDAGAAVSASQEFNGDGTAKVFTVTAKPATISGVKVGGTDSTDWTYDASTGKITFGSAPAAGTKNVVATYASTEAEKLVADCVLCDDTVVGTAADVVALAYRTGHFARNKLIVADDYTLTAADEQDLRKAGILLDDAINC